MKSYLTSEITEAMKAVETRIRMVYRATCLWALLCDDQIKKAQPMKYVNPQGENITIPRAEFGIKYRIKRYATAVKLAREVNWMLLGETRKFAPKNVMDKITELYSAWSNRNDGTENWIDSILVELSRGEDKVLYRTRRYVRECALGIINSTHPYASIIGEDLKESVRGRNYQRRENVICRLYMACSHNGYLKEAFPDWYEEVV